MCPNLAQEEEKLRQTTLELSACTYRVHVSFVKLARSDVMKPLLKVFTDDECAKARSSSNVPAPSARALSVPSAISVSNIP